MIVPDSVETQITAVLVLELWALNATVLVLETCHFNMTMHNGNHSTKRLYCEIGRIPRVFTLFRTCDLKHKSTISIVFRASVLMDVTISGAYNHSIYKMKLAIKAKGRVLTWWSQPVRHLPRSLRCKR